MLTAGTSISPEQAPSEHEFREEIASLQLQLTQAQRMATLGELISTTTHEFNNVLMAMINYTRLAMRQRDEESRQKSLRRVLDAGERAAKITNTILATARNRSDEFEPTDLRSLIEDALVLLERELNQCRPCHFHRALFWS